MDSSPTILTPSLLEQLEAELAARDPGLANRLAPGQSDAEIDDAMRQVGVTLSDEAKIWWRWHDGVPSRTVEPCLFGAALQFMTLDDATRTYRMHAQIDGESPDVHATNWWEPRWFPFVQRGSGTLNCDCSVPPGSPSAVRMVGHGLVGEIPEAPSVGMVVQWWLDALDTGAWFFDEGVGGWDSDDTLLPPERRFTGLV